MYIYIIHINYIICTYIFNYIVQFNVYIYIQIYINIYCPFFQSRPSEIVISDCGPCSEGYFIKFRGVLKGWSFSLNALGMGKQP